VQLDGGLVVLEGRPFHHLHHRHGALLRGTLESVAVGQEKVRPNVQVVPFHRLVFHAEDFQHNAVVPRVNHRAVKPSLKRLTA